MKLRAARRTTVKHRIDHEVNRPAELTADALHFLGGFEAVRFLRGELRPTLTTSYRRTTLWWAGCRATLDLDVCCAAAPAVAERGQRLCATFHDRVIVETKCPVGAGNFDRLLWRAGVRPIAVSKYAPGMAAIYPGLPSNKWHRTLDRHVVLGPGEPEAGPLLTWG